MRVFQLGAMLIQLCAGKLWILTRTKLSLPAYLPPPAMNDQDLISLEKKKINWDIFCNQKTQQCLQKYPEKILFFPFITTIILIQKNDKYKVISSSLANFKVIKGLYNR